MSGTPVGDAEREQMRQLHARGMSCNEIAKQLGRSAATVSAHCKALGLSFDRSQTMAATQAAVADNKALRAQAAREMLEDRVRLRERAWSSYTVVVSSMEGAEKVLLELPPAQETAAFYRSMGLCIDKSIAIDRHDSDDQGGMNAVDAWLRGMLGEGG